VSVRLRILFHWPDIGEAISSQAVQEVIAEIESIDSPHLFFVDDSLGLNRNGVKKLFTEMIPLRGNGWRKEQCR